jgi:hypothetical protein
MGIHVFMIPSWIRLRLRSVSDERCRENENISRFLFNIPPPPSESRVVSERVLKYMVQRDRPQMTIIIRRMRFAYWVTKTTITTILALQSVHVS